MPVAMQGAAIRRALRVAAPLVVLLATRPIFAALVAEQEPRTFPDSRDFLEAAAEPPALRQLSYPKPIAVPTLYRWAGRDAAAIERLQQELSFWSWWIFGLAVWASVRRPLARALALLATASLVLAPLRLGWTSALLSESISDSLLALVLAAVVLLASVATRLAPSARRTGACFALGAVVVATAGAWILARDSNAIAAAVAVATAAGLSWRSLARPRGPRGLAANAWAPVVAVLVLGLSLTALGAARTSAGESTRRGLRAAWVPEARPRAVYPMVNNVLRRILPDPRAVAFFRDRGMPWPAGIEEYAGRTASYRRHRFLTEPRFAPVVGWIGAHGTATYGAWLLRHPLERASEASRQILVLLGARSLPDWLYMPAGWVERSESVLEPLRQASRQPVLLVGALLLAPLWIVRTAPGALRTVGVAALVGGLAGTLASFYGDAMETGRHCWGAAQQIVAALVLIGVARLDAPRARAE